MSTDPNQVVTFSGKTPQLGEGVFLAPGSRVVGDVRLGDRVSVWFNAVLRGDIHFVSVGAGTNIQDNCTLHVDDEYPCVVGRDVIAGHGAILHGCTVEDGCLVGMGSVVLNGAHVGARSVVAAGAVIPEGMRVPAGHLVIGVGAKIVKPLPPGFFEAHGAGDRKYRRLAETYAAGVPYRWPDPDFEARDAAWLAGRKD